MVYITIPTLLRILSAAMTGRLLTFGWSVGAGALFYSLAYVTVSMLFDMSYTIDPGFAMLLVVRVRSWAVL